MGLSLPTDVQAHSRSVELIRPCKRPRLTTGSKAPPPFILLCAPPQAGDRAGALEAMRAARSADHELAVLRTLETARKVGVAWLQKEDNPSPPQKNERQSRKQGLRRDGGGGGGSADRKPLQELRIGNCIVFGSYLVLRMLYMCRSL